MGMILIAYSAVIGIIIWNIGGEDYSKPSDCIIVLGAATMAKNLGISAVTSPTPTSRYQSFRPKLGFLLREIFFYNFYLNTGK